MAEMAVRNTTATEKAARRGWRRLLLVAIVLAATALAFWALLSNSDELFGAADLLSRPVAAWLAAAVLVELVSYFAYGASLRTLISPSAGRPGLFWLTGLGAASQAAANCLPAGYAIQNIVLYRGLRRRGLLEGTAAWILLVVAGLDLLALALLAFAGSGIAGEATGAGDVRLGAGLLLAMIAAAALAVLALRRARRWRRLLEWSLQALGRRLGRRVKRPLAEARRWLERVRAAPLAGWRVLLAGCWLTASWLLDAACLGAAFLAVGGAPPWRILLLAYTAGQLVTVLPVTPGGLGVTEGSLTLALVAYGGSQQRTVAAVLLYRLLSYWALLPAGALCYLVIRLPRARVAATPAGAASL
jgi:putative heme transporter